MKCKLKNFCAVIATASALGIAAPARADPAPPAQREIAQLLAYLETSGCEFERSGKWYDASSARAHLDMKYKFLLQRNMVHTAEDFIKLAGTESYMGGGAYQVRCQGSVQPTAGWLRAELARMRKLPAAAPK